jgi:flagellar hook-associated protein 1 FlgK
MASLNDTLAIARSGVLTHQTRLAVIGHNIANVDTPGYHRQKVLLGTNPPLSSNQYDARRYDIGTGVRVLDIVRAYDDTKERMLLDQNSASELHSQLNSLLPDLEAMLQVDSDGGLAQQLQQFWAAWQDVATHPENLSMRNVLLERSGALADTFNNLSTNITDYRNNLADGAGTALDPFSGSVTTLVGEINDLATQIQNLNAQITRAERTGMERSDLLDRRDALVLELSGKVNITLEADQTIRIDGDVLVSGDGTTRNTLTQVATSPAVTVSLDGGATTLAISGGTLGAAIQTAGITDTLIANLDTMAGRLITAVNTLHAAGYNLDGNTGVNFFTGTGAASIAVNPTLYNPINPLLNNPRGVAAAATLNSAVPLIPNTGDGAQALAIADLGTTVQSVLANQTFGDFFTGLASALGSSIASEQALADDSAAVVDMLTNYVQSASGVNLDEEMVEMIAAQRAYEASAKVVVTVDEMMGTVIDMVR